MKKMIPVYHVRRKAELKREGYGRVVVLAQKKPPGGPACEKCKNLRFDGKGPVCVRGRKFEPIGCPDWKDASIDRVFI